MGNGTEIYGKKIKLKKMRVEKNIKLQGTLYTPGFLVCLPGPPVVQAAGTRRTVLGGPLLQDQVPNFGQGVLKYMIYILQIYLLYIKSFILMLSSFQSYD